MEAGEALSFLRARRKQKRNAEQRFDRFYYIYLLVFGMVVLVFYADQFLGVQILRTLELPRILGQVRALAPAILLLVFGAALRFCTWQGPVIFSSPDVEFLLSAPLPRQWLIRRKLIRGLTAGTLVGTALGLVLFAVLRGSLAGITGVGTLVLLLACLAGPCALGLLAAALGYHVECSAKLARKVAGYGWLMFPLAALIALLPRLLGPHTGGAAALLLGPWGWAAAPALAAAGGSVVLGLFGISLLAVAAAWSTVSAFAKAGDISREQLSRRAQLRSGLSGSLLIMDYRGAAQIGRDATRDPSGGGLGHLLGRPPRPRRPALCVPWRDLVWAWRNPGKPVWAVILGGGAVLAIQAAPGNVVVIFGAGLAAYFAAAQLVEPMRVENEAQEAARRLPYRYGGLVLRHAILPFVSLTLVGALAYVVGVFAGFSRLDPSPLVFVILPLLVCVLLVCAAAAAQRGTTPIHLIAFGNEGAYILIMWFLMGPLLALAALGLPAFIFVVGSQGGSVSLTILVSVLSIVVAIIGIGTGVLGGRRFAR